ncbi:uncharacterized protein LOC129950625 [Eupeodes corollae]|uniref:uncharacterized protein LOC129950625 n=1 Tax=Eupeodes corollae TaxID=290404 RepID=UPI0024931225|nr:uncharacterized protein LOC129950625 [Eupeodes corollae]
MAKDVSTTKTLSEVGSGKFVKNDPSTTKQSKPLQNAPRSSYKQRRYAMRILKSSGSSLGDGSNPILSKRQEWAKSILDKTSHHDSTSKRQRSLEEPTPVPKKPKVQNTSTPNMARVPLTKPFSEVLKEPKKIIVAVIDRSNIDGTITSDRWQMGKLGLSAGFLKVMREHPGPPPVTSDWGWHQGHVKLIACNDQRSRDLYTLAVGMLGEVWPGAKLEVVAKEDIPCRPRARAWIPIEPSCPDDISAMIRISNPNLPCHDWKIAKLEEPKGLYRSAIIVINKDSVASLARDKGVIRYGFESVTLRVYKKDEADASCEPPQPPSKAVSQDVKVFIDFPVAGVSDK